MEKRVTYDNAIPPGCQCQPEERESPGAEDTLWAASSKLPCPRPPPLEDPFLPASAYSQLSSPIKRRVPATSFQRYLAQL